MAARAGTSESVVLRIALAEGLQAMAPWNRFLMRINGWFSGTKFTENHEFVLGKSL